ncbi:MAG: DNA-binding protein [Desulfuromonadaceae bacterium]|nr:DNA-binding protein [Desulfuromonadaceae bacterium]
MKPTHIIMYLLAALSVSSPHISHAFWGNDSDTRSGLNLENGYDANTVTTLTGRIVSLQIGDERRSAQFEMESGTVRAVVVLGPYRYWAERGIALKVGDDVTVRGSKAQGTDGTVYLLAQKITDITQKTDISLRSESGRPAWAGGGMGSGAGQMNGRSTPLRQQSPGRMGGGRMGR